MGKFLDETGLAYFWEKIRSWFRLGNFYRLQTKTYTGVVVTGDSDPAGYLYFAKILPDAYGLEWEVLYKVSATVKGVTDANGGGKQSTYVYYHGRNSVMLNYSVYNNTAHTSYRAYYQHAVYYGTKTGINSGYGHAIGFRLQSSYNPTTTANSRTFEIEVLWTKGCEVSFLDSMVTYANLPGTGSTNYASRNVYEAVTAGLTTSGDRNDYASYVSAWRAWSLPIGTGGLRQYGLLMQDEDGNFQSLTTTSGSGTAKTKNSSGFRLGQLYYLNSGSNFATGTTLGGVQVRRQQYNLDLRYSTNCGSTLTQSQPVYIVGTMADGLFYLADTWWTQTEPTTDDGKVYVYAGMATSTYQVDFSGWCGAYWYKDGAFQKMVPSSADVKGTVSIAHGGTGATTAEAARTALGVGNVGTLTYDSSDVTKFLRNDGTWEVPSFSTAARATASDKVMVHPPYSSVYLTGSLNAPSSEAAYKDIYAGGEGLYYNTDDEVLYAKVARVADVENLSGDGIQFALDSNGKGLYRAVGASTWIPFLSGGGGGNGITMVWGAHEYLGGSSNSTYNDHIFSLQCIDDSKFTISDDGITLTCIQGGDYTITRFGRGVGYPKSSSTLCYQRYRLYVNGTQVQERTDVNVASTNVYSQTFATGDTLTVRCSHSVYNNSTKDDLGLMIVEATE